MFLLMIGPDARTSFAEITSEFNVNYIAIVTLITFFLPHLLKLGVSATYHVIRPPSNSTVSS